MNTKLIQVLWVEDDQQIAKAYPMEAARYGIELVPYPCWEDAEKALLYDFKRWSAIVLDAKCKYKKDSHDNAAIFLGQAINSITLICSQKHRILPWYVLSGGSEEELSDLIIDNREEWDGDWSKKYYSKTSDRDILFRRIPYHARISPEMQIRLIYYPDVFNAIKRIGLDSEVENHMEDLLLPIHRRDVSEKDYNERMTLVRKVIEYIFYSMSSHRILPSKETINKTIISNKLIDKRGGINITWCSKLIAGKDVPDENNTAIKSYCNILPNVLKDTFHRLIEIASAYEHSPYKEATEEQIANSRQTTVFLNMINNAPYLLRGMAMDLCNIILWYDQYLLEHDDDERNALNWDVISKED